MLDSTSSGEPRESAGAIDRTLLGARYSPHSGYTPEDASSYPEPHSQFYGNIDDIRIYNRALSKSEIQQLYQGCHPSIDIVLNSNNRVTGDKVVVNAHIKGPASPDSSCEPTKVVETVWVELPDGFVISLIQPFTALTLLPGDNIETKIFEYTFNGNEPLGSYEIGGSFLHPLSGKNISTDIEILTFSQ
jgi:hypothetical protein